MTQTTTNLSEEKVHEIINKIVDGDTHAFRFLVKQYEHYVYTAAYKIVGNQEDAEDVAQEAFLKAFKSLKQFDSRAKFSTWLYRIAINTAISKRRKKRFHTSDIDESPVSSIVRNENSLKLNEQRHYLQLAFNQMQEDDVTALTLFYLKELRLNEIAEILEIEVNLAKVRVHRARKKLAIVLQELLNDEAKTLI